MGTHERFVAPGWSLSQSGCPIPLSLAAHGLFPAAMECFGRLAFQSCLPARRQGGRNAESVKLDPWKTYLASL
jgi:hypothetical protein